MYIIKVKIDNKWEQVFEGNTERVCNKWWKENSEDYVHHPKYQDCIIKEVQYSFFKAVYDTFEILYKVVKCGMDTNKDSTAHTIQRMKNVNGTWVEDVKTPLKVVVFSPLKGVTINVTDEEIWEVMGLANASKAERAKNIKRFNEHRSYFDSANDADYCTWHEPNDRVGANHFWMPLVSL